LYYFFAIGLPIKSCLIQNDIAEKHCLGKILIRFQTNLHSSFSDVMPHHDAASQMGSNNPMSMGLWGLPDDYEH
jgi:hypothetical protein